MRTIHLLATASICLFLAGIGLAQSVSELQEQHSCTIEWNSAGRMLTFTSTKIMALTTEDV